MCFLDTRNMHTGFENVCWDLSDSHLNGLALNKADRICATHTQEESTGKGYIRSLKNKASGPELQKLAGTSVLGLLVGGAWHITKG